MTSSARNSAGPLAALAGSGAHARYDVEEHRMRRTVRQPRRKENPPEMAP